MGLKIPVVADWDTANEACEWACAASTCANIRCEDCLLSHDSLYIDYLEDKEKTMDNINSPNHYKLFHDTEAIDVIKKTLTKEEFIGYCKGNILKYRLRAGNKDDVVQEIDKAKKYREFMDDYLRG